MRENRRPPGQGRRWAWGARALLGVGVAALLLFHQGWRVPYLDVEVGGQGVDPQALKALNALRVDTRRRWRVASGFRNADHNRKVGGAQKSQHVKGRAFDLHVPLTERAAFYDAAKRAGFVAFGWGNNTVHVDLGPRRWWTYDDAGRHLSGRARYPHLDKAPANFKRDFALRGR